MGIVKTKDLTFEYIRRDEEGPCQHRFAGRAVYSCTWT